MAGSPLDAEALDLLGGHAAPVPAAAAGGGAAAAPAPAPTAAGSGGVSAAAAPQGARQGPGTRLAIPVGVDDDEIQASMAALDAEMASGSAASFLDDVHAAPATAAAARRERRRKEAAARAAGGPSGTPPAKRSRPEVIDVDADSDEAERPDGPPAAAPAASATAADRDADGPGPGAAALVAVPQRAAAAAALPGGQMVLVDPEGPAGPPVPVPEVPAGPPIPVPVPVPVPAAPAAPQREGGAELAAHHAASVTAACGSLAGEVAALRFALQSTDAESARLRAALAASPARQEAPPSPPPQPPEGSPPQPPAGPTRPAPLQVPCEPTHAARSGASTATPTAGSVRGGRDMGHSSPALAALASAWSFRREYPGSACPQEAPAAAAAAPAAAGEGTATLAEVPAAAERREWRKGDAVRVVSDLGAARRAQPSWVDAMDATAGQAGVVTKVIEPGPGGDVLCRVAGREWIYAMDNLDEDHGPAVTPQLSAAGASGWTVGGSGQAATDPAAPGSPPNMTEDTREQTAAACGRNLSARSAAAGAALPASISASALSMLPMPGGAAEHSAREPAVTAASPASASFASSAARPHSIAATPYGEVSMRIAHASMMSVAPPPAIGSLSLLSVQCPTGDLSTRAGLPSSTASAAPPAGESEQRGEQSQRSPSCSSGSLRGASAGRLPTSAADARDPGAPPAVSIVTLEPPDWDESVRAAAAAAALPASAISAQPHGASTRAAAAAAALPASALSAAPPGRSVERGAAAQPPQLAASAAAPDGAESVRGAAAVAALPQSVVSQAPPGQSLRAAGAAAALPESAVSSPPQRGGSPPAAAAPPAAPPEGGRPPLRKGDAVLVEADPAAARRAQPSWVAAMDSATGQQGVVTKVLQPGPDGEMFVRVAGQEWHIFAANLTRADSTGPQEKREEAPKPPAAPPPPRPPPPQPLWGCRAVQLLCLARGPPRGRGLDLLAEAGGFRFGSIVDAWQAQEDSWRRMSANAATLGYASDARLSIGGPQGVQHVTGLSAVRDFWGRVFAALAPQQGDWVGPPGDPPPERRAHLLPGGLVIAATWSCPGRGFSSVEERLTFSPSTWRITEHSVILE
eukprot:TRINITY_DN1108_c0_g2_i1.p1 TRINITY_DN1108_c0_g2~~TRINITY_DN1108_c0_g2_i1.p1  ORF type:complete len:1125 (+),score=261.33 TRINITY_DN1108_c0_g2_i1:94-3375(+)